MNGFEQIKNFYSWVFNNQDKGITPQHISLYNFLINQNNRNNWVEWFKCPYDLAMSGSCIGNKKTYYKCLEDLQDWKLIQYVKGVNNYKAPLIKIEVLNRTSTGTATVPTSEPVEVPQHTTLPTTLPTHIYKLITNNLKLITINIDRFENFIIELSKDNLLTIDQTKEDFKNAESLRFRMKSELNLTDQHLDKGSATFFNIYAIEYPRTWKETEKHIFNWFRKNVKELKEQPQKHTPIGVRV